MKTIRYTSYGSPEVLTVVEAEKPAPKSNEVLVRIHATTVTTTETYFRQGKPVVTRLFTGPFKPRIQTLGEELAGEIVAVGAAVTRFKPGDQIFGTAGPDFGANAEYLCIPEDGVITTKPANASYGEAAGSVDGFLTAMPFLRDKGEIREGQEVMIYGASGSVGSSAVQIAKEYGTTVTAVCSGRNAELVKSIGADKVVDYTKEDFSQSEERYDLIFDAVGKTNFSTAKKVLKPQGIFLEAGVTMGIMPAVIWTSMFGSKKARIHTTGIRPPADRLKDLEILKQWMEAGHIKPVIDRTFSLDDIVEAHRYVDTGRKRGNVVVEMG